MGRFQGAGAVVISAITMTMLSLSEHALGFLNTATTTTVHGHKHTTPAWSSWSSTLRPKTTTKTASRPSCSRRRPYPNQERVAAPALKMAAAGGSDEGGGFGDLKPSRRAAKRAKARGEVGTKGGSATAAATSQAPATVSSAVVADTLRQQQPVGDADAAAARKAIEKMEQEEAKRLDERQARIDSVLQAKEATEDDPTAGVIPQVVADRMLQRMVPFFLLPAICGVGIFVGVYVLAHQYDFTIPAYIVAYATQAPFFVALAGITYAILSSSWDEEREGTFLGSEEVSRNLGIIKDGLRRSSDRMDVEDMLADQERAKRQANRSERRRMRRQQQDKS